MRGLNQPNPCGICRGKSKHRCIICGHRAPKGSERRKDPKEYTQAERREDFLGSLYNAMRQYGMPSLGSIGTYRDHEVIVRGTETDGRVQIVLFREHFEVSASEVEDRRGALAKYRSQQVVIRGHSVTGKLRVSTFRETLLVEASEVTDITPCSVDEEVLRFIGDPLASGARPYEPHRKLRKNEVG